VAKKKKHLVHKHLPHHIDRTFAALAVIGALIVLLYVVSGNIATVGKAVEAELLSLTFAWEWDDEKDSFGNAFDEQSSLRHRFFAKEWDVSTCSVGDGEPPLTPFWPIADHCLVNDDLTLHQCVYSACRGKVESWTTDESNLLISECWEESCRCCKK
jgi:hypothetical protein